MNGKISKNLKNFIVKMIDENTKLFHSEDYNEVIIRELVHTQNLDLLDEFICETMFRNKEYTYISYIYEVAKYGNIEMFQYFLINTDKKYIKLREIIFLLIERKDNPIKMLDIFWNIINSEERKEIINDLNKFGRSMNICIENGNYLIYRFLVDNGFEPSVYDFGMAIYCGHFDFADFIISINNKIVLVYDDINENFFGETLDYILELEYNNKIIIDDCSIINLILFAHNHKKEYEFKKLICLFPLLVPKIIEKILPATNDYLSKMDQINKQIMEEFVTEKN